MEKTKEKQTTENVSPLLYCSFCGKSQEAVQKILAGPAVCICDECVKKFTKMIPNTFKLPEKQRLVDMFFEGCRRIYMNKMERWRFVWLTTLATLLFQVATLFLLVLVLVMPDW